MKKLSKQKAISIMAKIVAGAFVIFAGFILGIVVLLLLVAIPKYMSETNGWDLATTCFLWWVALSIAYNKRKGD